MKTAFNRGTFFSVVSQRATPEEPPPPKQPENSDILDAIKESNSAVLELADAVRANSEAVAAGNAALLEALSAMSEKLADLKPEPIDNEPMLKALDKLAVEVRANKPLKSEITKDRTDELVSALSRVEAAVGTVRAAVLTPVSLEYDRLGEPYQAVRREE
jgi:hypothetical protein